jgi:hypothetical protein
MSSQIDESAWADMQFKALHASESDFRVPPEPYGGLRYVPVGVTKNLYGPRAQ